MSRRSLTVPLSALVSSNPLAFVTYAVSLFRDVDPSWRYMLQSERVHDVLDSASFVNLHLVDDMQGAINSATLHRILLQRFEAGALSYQAETGVIVLCHNNHLLHIRTGGLVELCSHNDSMVTGHVYLLTEQAQVTFFADADANAFYNQMR